LFTDSKNTSANQAFTAIMQKTNMYSVQQYAYAEQWKHYYNSN